MDEVGLAEIAARYARFADTEAHGRSPLYEELARAVAGDRVTLGFLSTLPDMKRQPNLLLAAVRHLFGTPTGWTEFRQALLAHPNAVRSLMLERSTQTNEPGRCAALLPVLARLPQPLALLEVGTSAGLCLMPDLYGYDYGPTVIRAPAMPSEPPVFRCSASETTPLPTAAPQVVWRAGLDLSPIDAADPAQVAWLETLVWPEQTARLANLRAAVRIAATVKPRIVKGDLRGSEIARLCSEAPKDATLVVFHTAVLDYVSDPADREAFAEQVMRLSPYWVSNEFPRVFPSIASRAGTNWPSGRFLLSVNGSPVAWTDPHGASLDWIADEA
ncbi:MULTISPECIES: DUF2332 domain-containing protein [Mesorhizobium]|uniref:DUF2332 domain-containing protein n=1 Tax=Mesorhizobium shonense TaxID=1209948 RepID=A0ABV2HVK8_9HYPH|nr:MULTISPECIES: DUF2332 domain-containing protein [unclassified Mesorhizobium]AZO26326.1 DUF2332 domain-containing protein [Mesorhizobium sp. M1B.F.Ca.ET.045.04.1.1]RWA68617.1 MAG: DUF2332 family protein [Mesorhizobium sp.]RWA83796.1 MAG: DUF2332 family protein [Mesorhizobium sp.]RWE03913.1 MAG: DUF2332 family protein [Mesorhizobium sp.]TIS49401.1 MAG: DUF2332 domain-containing protein [Mesorhizobium sp.]